MEWIIAIMSAVLAAVCMAACVIARETMCDREVIDSVLKTSGRRHVRVLYGTSGTRPFTWGRDRTVRILARVDATGVDVAPERCVEAGIRLQHALGYDGSEYLTPRPRWHEWRLNR